MYGATHDEGLGFWTALIPVGIEVGRQALTDDNMASDVYYPDAKRGVVHCPGPYDVVQVAEAYSHVDLRSPEGRRLRSDIVSLLGTDAAWRAANYGMPTDPRGIAGALVAWAHGGRDCTREGTVNERRANELVARILQLEEERRATLQARAAQVAAGARAIAGSELVPGLPTPLLAAAILGGAWLWGRAR